MNQEQTALHAEAEAAVKIEAEARRLAVRQAHMERVSPMAAAGTLAVGGAILDVTDPEPLPAASPLWGLPNVILTPHVAAATEDIETRAAAFAGDFLAKLARGETLDNLVERDKGY